MANRGVIGLIVATADRLLTHAARGSSGHVVRSARPALPPDRRRADRGHRPRGDRARDATAFRAVPCPSPVRQPHDHGDGIPVAPRQGTAREPPGQRHPGEHDLRRRAAHHLDARSGGAQAVGRLFEEPTGAIDLSLAVIQDTDALSDDVLSLTTRDVARPVPGHGYVPFGIQALRQRIAAGLTEGGLPTTEHQLLVTTGAQQAIRLIAELFVRPGDPVAVRHPATRAPSMRSRGRGPDSYPCRWTTAASGLKHFPPLCGTGCPGSSSSCQPSRTRQELRFPKADVARWLRWPTPPTFPSWRPFPCLPVVRCGAPAADRLLLGFRQRGVGGIVEQGVLGRAEGRLGPCRRRSHRPPRPVEVDRRPQ